MRKPFRKIKHIQQVTPDGYRAMEEQLQMLCTERHEVRQHLRDLREQQASDGFDLTDTVRALESLNDDIEKLRVELRQVVVIKPTRHNVARLGAVIHLKNGKHSITYQLVSSREADPSSGKISSESPLGRALIGKRINQLVQFVSPKVGLLRYRITKLQ